MFFSSRRRHTRLQGDWSSDVCSSDLSNVTLCCGSVRNTEFPDGEMLGSSVMTLVEVSCRRSMGEPGLKLARLIVARSEERRVGKEFRCRLWGESSYKEESREEMEVYV